MAELGFILSRQEEEALVRSALDVGASLVPDMDYTTPDAAQITTYPEYEEHRRQTRMFFILHPSYVTAPIGLRETPKDNKRVFFIVQRTGGPTVDFLSSVEFSEAGRSKINPGFLAHHKTFWNTKTQRNEDMPAALLELYRELSLAVKRMAIRQRVGVRTYWVGKAVQKLIENGVLDLGIVTHPKDEAIRA